MATLDEWLERFRAVELERLELSEWTAKREVQRADDENFRALDALSSASEAANRADAPRTYRISPLRGHAYESG